MPYVPVLPTTWITQCQAMFLTGKYGHRWVFEGRTTDATATEVFLEGVNNKRLYLPRNAGAVFGQVSALAYNVTDGNVISAYRAGAFAAERLANGTFQAANGVDFDGTGGENQIVTLGTAGQGIGVVEFGAAGNTLTIDLQGSGASSDPFVRFRVTGQASKTILWQVVVDPILYRSVDDDANLYDSY